MRLQYILTLLLSLICLNNALLAQVINTEDTIQDPTKVAILCYHDFAQNGTATETTILNEKFSEQIEALKKAGVHFLTLEEFKAWKLKGQKIPSKSVLITMDDGWSSVYEQAYPVLLKNKIPFTLFIYSNYLNRGGRSLSKNRLLTMLAHGASLGSHSHTHPLPPFIKEQQSKLDDTAFSAFIKKEFQLSKDKLESISRKTIDTYAYPGGYFQTEMFDIA